MLQSQVNYWNLQETKRHNMVMEQLEGRKTDYQGLSAQASMTQAETSRMLVPAEFEKARASTLQAEASKENVQVNWANAFTNARNADINQMNADTNRINAGVNLFNAETNRMNAETQRMGTESQISLNKSQEKVNSSIISLNKSAQDLNYAKGFNEAIDYEKGLIDLPYQNANNILDLIESGSKSYSNIVGSTGTFARGIGSLISNRHGKDSSGNSNGMNVKTLIDGIETFISVGKLVMP